MVTLKLSKSGKWLPSITGFQLWRKVLAYFLSLNHLQIEYIIVSQMATSCHIQGKMFLLMGAVTLRLTDSLVQWHVFRKGGRYDCKKIELVWLAFRRGGIFL